MANITAVELTPVKRHGREAHPGQTSGPWSSPRSNITAVKLTPVKRQGCEADIMAVELTWYNQDAQPV